MGHQSIVSGYIKLRGLTPVEPNLQSINQFPFDEVYPFTNIFWGGSPAHYSSMIIGFAGSYKQIEEDWREWLWKFSQLLSRLEATEARVYLDCMLGNYSWEFRPRSLCKTTAGRYPDSFIGEQWVITDAPAEDFSLLHTPIYGGSVSEWEEQVPRWSSDSALGDAN